jgi:16S rRNA (guanine527-N7)-methyltransferase
VKQPVDVEPLLEDVLPSDAPAAAAEQLAILVQRITKAPLNVTAVRDADDIVTRHVVDALRGLPAVDRLPDGPLADVGSGGGIPGLVIAALRPQRSMTLIDSTVRKAAFIEEAALAMGLDVRVEGARSEELAASELREAFVGVLARALAPPPVAAELCLPLCRKGGSVLLWLGEQADEATLAEATVALGGRVEEFAPGGVTVLTKVAATPDGFPRRPGMAGKRPLVREVRADR